MNTIARGSRSYGITFTKSRQEHFPRVYLLYISGHAQNYNSAFRAKTGLLQIIDHLRISKLDQLCLVWNRIYCGFIIYYGYMFYYLEILPTVNI